MLKVLKGVVCLMVLVVAASGAWATSITGDPSLDGWHFQGNSLSNGVYVRGDGNYGYDAYTAAITIAAGSNLEIADGTNSWLAGDTVLGAGGCFASINAVDAGWSAFSGVGVNSLFSSSNGPKLQAKFGNSDATWSTSTLAPNSGNGAGSLDYGGVAVQIRTGTYYTPDGPEFVPGEDQAGILGWDTNAGVLMHLGKSSYITCSSGSGLTMNRNVGRVIWTETNSTGEPASWELLLNVSLLERLNPGYVGAFPAFGDNIIMSVQDNDGKYTDALVQTTVPEPGTVVLLLTAGLGMLLCTSRRRAS